MAIREFNAMKIYVLYVVTALLHIWIILFNFGFSKGLSNCFPELALAGSVLLFNVASPILIHNIKIGLVVGLINLLLVFPYSFVFTIGLFADWGFSWGILLVTIPIIMALYSLYLTSKYLIFNGNFVTIKHIDRTVKVLFSIIPVLLSVMYVLTYGRNWNWKNLFK